VLTIQDSLVLLSIMSDMGVVQNDAGTEIKVMEIWVSGSLIRSEDIFSDPGLRERFLKLLRIPKRKELQNSRRKNRRYIVFK
jgi:hypothetical protein